MVSDPGATARRAFAEIGPKNPLAKLSKSDKESLYTLLTLYERSSKNPPSDPWEEIENLPHRRPQLHPVSTATYFRDRLAKC